jgi:hypothetical protein
MVKYLSYGAGVNSEALRLLLIDQGIEFEGVYMDHGCDWPETREFAKTIPGLTIVKPDVIACTIVWCLAICAGFVRLNSKSGHSIGILSDPASALLAWPRMKPIDAKKVGSQIFAINSLL